MTPRDAVDDARGAWREVLVIFFRLGLTSFGGPVAHLGYFREEFVTRRRWLTEEAYADLIALCQFLPGPASSQVGMALGLSRAGFAGMVAAWVGFTLPSAVAIVAFAYGVETMGDSGQSGWLRGLKIVAVAVVAQAVCGMARTLCPDRVRASLMVVAAAIVLLEPSAYGQIAAIIVGGFFGLAMLGETSDRGGSAHLAVPVSQHLAVGALCTFGILLIGLPVLAAAADVAGLQLFDSFYRSGSLVFGGGHVVLPLLEAELVIPGWITPDDFIAGYGAAQAVPGPLFTFSAYLGVLAQPGPGGLIGALVCLIGIFLPSFLLLLGTLPFWDSLRAKPQAQSALRGVNAAVVGLLISALYDPVWTKGIHGPEDFALAVAAFVALQLWKVPPWLVVLACAAIAGAASAV